MADRLDVAERLAEGRPAVDHTHRYVRACQQVGLADPDLEVRDCFESEDGLDLRALDGDCAQLRAAGAAVTEALRLQRAQISELTAAWMGPGAEAAVRFLQRHCDAANEVATEIRAAAQRCESLRDNLWHLVDSKVATAIAIDDRSLAQRPVWLAAADTVTSGGGDRPAAEELLRQQVKPYVDNDIRDEWLTFMRSARAGVAAAYDMVIDRMATAMRGYFEIPGDLGPMRQAVGSTTLAYLPQNPVPATAARAGIAPAAIAPAAIAPTATPAAAAPALPADPAAAMMPPLATTSWAPADGSALGGIGGPNGLSGLSGLGGLGGLADRIVDAMGSALGSAGDELTGDPFNEDIADDDPNDENAAESEPRENAAKADKVEEVAVDEPAPAEQAPGVAEPPAAQPPPAGEVPVAQPHPPDPPVKGSTPCEIAADELPKAGQ